MRRNSQDSKTHFFRPVLPIISAFADACRKGAVTVPRFDAFVVTGKRGEAVH
jgi:hypothetical protein